MKPYFNLSDRDRQILWCIMLWFGHYVGGEPAYSFSVGVTSFFCLVAGALAYFRLERICFAQKRDMEMLMANEAFRRLEISHQIVGRN